MSENNMLEEEQVLEISNMANCYRREYGFLEDAPIGNDIMMILDKLGIVLFEYPIMPQGDRPAFSAALTYYEYEGKELVFIGLNTADYYDKQIFALSHELYHYFKKTGSHISRLEETPDTLTEMQANRFSAEFLLPEKSFKHNIFREFGTISLEKTPQKTILRFIARQQCTWWLPYRSIVRRLEEINAINQEQYKSLYKVDERSPEGEYSRMGMAINSNVFSRLNQKTMVTGVSSEGLEALIRNYEDGIIDEDTFNRTLELFELKPEDFGYIISQSDSMMPSWDDFIDEEDEDED